MADKNYRLTFEMTDGTEKAVTFTAPQGPQGDKGEKGDTGAAGSVYVPSVDAAGNLSWSPSASTLPTTAVNIKGPRGEKGDTGNTGAAGAAGVGVSGVRIEEV